MRRLALILVFLMFGAATAAVPATAAEIQTQEVPSTIDLPEGYFPEGIASGSGATFYVGSLADGTIYKGNYRTGEGEVFTDPVGPFSTIGLAVDHRGRVWAAGGGSGTARAYDGRTGELLAVYALTGPFESFINDVIITPDGAWFTDSGTQNSPDPANFQFAGEPRLFKIPLNRGVRLPDPSEVMELPVDMPDIAFPNLNGIETAPDGRGLIVAHNVEGTLYRVNRFNGAAVKMDLAQILAGPDGMVRDGTNLYVVEPGANRVSTIRLNNRGSAGRITRQITVPDGESPTTAALFGRGLYVVDAHFFTQTGPYFVTRIPLSCQPIDAIATGHVLPPQAGDPEMAFRTTAEIGGGLLKGTAEALYAVTEHDDDGLTFEGHMQVAARPGLLNVGLDGTFDRATGTFAAAGPVAAGSSGGFQGAVGNLALDGPMDGDGTFRLRVTGEVCADLG